MYVSNDEWDFFLNLSPSKQLDSFGVHVSHLSVKSNISQFLIEVKNTQLKTVPSDWTQISR